MPAGVNRRASLRRDAACFSEDLGFGCRCRSLGGSNEANADAGGDASIGMDCACAHGPWCRHLPDRRCGR